MNEGKQNPQFSLLDHLLTLVRWKKFIILNFFIVSVIAVIISLSLPNWYRAKSVILPPSEKEGFDVQSIMGQIPEIGFLLGGSESLNYYLSILYSRTLKTNVINKLDLKNYYKSKDIEYALLTFDGNVDVDLTKEGAIEIIVFDKIPDKAADIANAIVHELNLIDTKLSTEKAHFNRVFIEERYHQAEDDLENIENKQKKFQEENGTFSLPTQIEVGIRTGAELEAKIMSKEIELRINKSYLSANSPEVLKIQSELNELKNAFEDLKYGGEGKLKGLLLPFHTIPEKGIQYARFLREVELHAKLIEFLLPQYEQARLQEAKDIPMVQVVDKAIPPLKKAKPRRSVIVLLAAFMSFMVSVVMVISIEYYRQIKSNQSERYYQIKKIIDEIKIKKN